YVPDLKISPLLYVIAVLCGSIVYNGGNMTCGGLRATSLSTVTKLDAGQKLSTYHCARHWLYCLLAVVFLIFSQIFIN
ncbi:MAG: hypothetical protein JXB49_35465, partial [Bacteroidales bacterium]|nr:hypothetical protein [Bacteroidales bacterium]